MSFESHPHVIVYSEAVDQELKGYASELMARPSPQRLAQLSRELISIARVHDPDIDRDRAYRQGEALV